MGCGPLVGVSSATARRSHPKRNARGLDIHRRHPEFFSINASRATPPKKILAIEKPWRQRDPRSVVSHPAMDSRASHRTVDAASSAPCFVSVAEDERRTTTAA